MAVTNYLSIDGEVLMESGTTEEERIMYIRDGLGSVVATADSKGNVLNTYMYKPSGAVWQKTGSAPDPRFLWCGTWGYRASSNSWNSHYVRARHYSHNSGAWTTVDPLFPGEMAYGYAGGRVTSAVDATGLQKQQKQKYVAPHSFPEACRGCAFGIFNEWFPLLPHKCNACYAHCTACCVLDVLAKGGCAQAMQDLQNTLKNPGKQQYIDARNKYCKFGQAIAKTIKNAVDSQKQCSNACLEKCPYKKPNPRSECDKLLARNKKGVIIPKFKPEFPYLDNCDPLVWLDCRGR
ncbi:MAG: hypothetical protein JNM28_02915 [Armatimonadetes bacterium]|nr:hypothetical protein [Armatimonadota bacterium]